MIRFLFKLTLLITISIFIISCGGNGDSLPIELRTKPISIKEFDTSPGANPAISAEMGGVGFEKIAASLGWKTNSPEPDGSPEAKKGGRFTMSFTDFPASLRSYGKDSNYEVISMMSSLVYESLLSIDSKTLDLIPNLCTHWKMSEDFKKFHLSSYLPSILIP